MDVLIVKNSKPLLIIQLKDWICQNIWKEKRMFLPFMICMQLPFIMVVWVVVITLRKKLKNWERNFWPSLTFSLFAFLVFKRSCKNWKTGKWFRFDDSSVSSEPEGSKLQTAAAYLLFYQLRQPNTNGNTTTTTSTTSTTNDVPMKEEVGNVDQPMKDA